jgi:hypothetical protein
MHSELDDLPAYASRRHKNRSAESAARHSYIDANDELVTAATDSEIQIGA